MAEQLFLDFDDLTDFGDRSMVVDFSAYASGGVEKIRYTLWGHSACVVEK